jgi:hypothetical protein
MPFGGESGVHSLLKSFGVDPEALKADMKSTVENFSNEMKKLNETMARIERKLDQLTAELHAPESDPAHAYPSDVPAMCEECKTVNGHQTTCRFYGDI